MFEKEILLITLKEKYSEEVIQIINDCQLSGKNYLDIEALNLKLKSLAFMNISESLCEDDWLELLYELLPDLYDELSCQTSCA